MDQKRREVKLEILRRFNCQADFAQAVGMDESLVSRILHGRRPLKPEQAAIWAKVLNVKPKVLEAVTG